MQDFQLSCQAQGNTMCHKNLLENATEQSLPNLPIPHTNTSEDHGTIAEVSSATTTESNIATV